ncbi:ABC transporter permease [Arenimonas fontis]|uniref:FtsX-like permease family protein n=1 Tax=Arenimonas fontis TaxID=2608255 RepID=A0A5B2Z9V4_9GAMM|nr:FtsX-like permease family protein [Arenimonas fontis]KAA2284303.1 FtsX-like permease family protein [Arenimonas fontis]
MEIRPILSAMLRAKTAPLLIAAQVALTLAIVCNALYIIRDRLQVAARPTGADEQNLFEMRFYPHRPIADIKGMQLRDLEALRAIPGVVAAGWTNQIPLGQSGWNWGGLTADRRGDTQLSTTYYFSGDSVIETFGLRLVEGRDFTPEEYIEIDPSKEQRNPTVMIVTRALAEKLFPGETSFVGRSFYLGSGPDADSVRIVGVVERLQTPYGQTDDRVENSMIGPVRYIDPFTRYSVRTEPGAQDRVMAEAEKALTALSKDRVLLGTRTFAEARASRYAGERMLAGLLIAVTVFLLLITASGIVGMASLWVNQRRKQIGVRRALGARQWDILRYFLVENLLITTGGVAVGLGLALALNDFLVRALELPRLPGMYLGIGMAVMWLLGLTAVLGPAWRAARVPPAVATRTA